jgi:hypothetical protein
MEKSKLRHFGNDKLLKCPLGEKKNIKIRIKTASFWLKLGFPTLTKTVPFWYVLGIKKKKVP